MVSQRKKKINNLNDLLPIRKPGVEVRGLCDLRVIFDGIEDCIVNSLGSETTAKAYIMSPWFTSQPILKTLVKHNVRVRAITNVDRAMKKSKRRNDIFAKLTPCVGFGGDRVRTLGRGKGRGKAIPHQKFVVLFDEKSCATGVYAGSYNLSGNQENLEFMVYSSSPELCKVFTDEFERVWDVSKTYA